MHVCVPGSRHLRIRVLADIRMCLIRVEKSPGINCRDSNNDCGFVIGAVIIIELNWKARASACVHVCSKRIRKQMNTRRAMWR